MTSSSLGNHYVSISLKLRNDYVIVMSWYLTWVNQKLNMSHSQIVSDFAFSQIFSILLKIHRFSKIEFEIRLAVHQQSLHYDSLCDHQQRHHFDSRLVYMLRFCMCLNKWWSHYHVILMLRYHLVRLPVFQLSNRATFSSRFRLCILSQPFPWRGYKRFITAECQKDAFGRSESAIY